MTVSGDSKRAEERDASGDQVVADPHASAEAGAAKVRKRENGHSAKGAQGHKKRSSAKAGTFVRARRWTVGILFIVVAASLIWHTGAGTLSAIGISSIALVCPLGSLETMLSGRTFMIHPFLLFVLVIVVTVIFGKAFCSWLCPSGFLQRFFRPKGKTRARRVLSENVENEEDQAVSATTSADGAATSAVAADGVAAGNGGALPPIGGKRDGSRLDGRHLVLAGALLSSLVFGFPVFCLICPIGLTFATFIGIWHLFQYNEVSWALIVFPAIIVLELVVMRTWCLDLCPISALLSLVSRANRTFVPTVEPERCLRSDGANCRVCVDSCPEEVDPHSPSIPECTKCGVCIDSCPAKAIEMRLLGRTKAGSAKGGSAKGEPARISGAEGARK